MVKLNWCDCLKEMGRKEETEYQYNIVQKTDPYNLTGKSNYRILLKEIGLNEESEAQYKFIRKPNSRDATKYSKHIHLKKRLIEESNEQYKLAQKAISNDESTPKYPLSKKRRNEEAEEEYNIVVKINPNDAVTHSNYGYKLFKIGRYQEAEEQYRISLKTDPNNASVHYNYGYLLFEMNRNEEAEEQYKLAIKLDYNNPNSHAIYSLFLIHMDLKNEELAIEEMLIASRISRDKGDRIKEHLFLAWLYEDLAYKYYRSEKYQESGQCAGLSGNMYIEAGKHAGEKFKSVLLTRGYTLKGRSEIRKLDKKDLQPPYNEKMFTKIIKSIYNASNFYEKATEGTLEDNQLCNACSLSLRCLSEMLDYMFALIDLESKKTLIIEEKIKKWREVLANCEKIYNGNEKGENFIKSLYKVIVCLENLDKYKESAMVMDKLILEDCIRELSDIAEKIEGPLQKIIGDSARQINFCKSKIVLHKGIVIEDFLELDQSQKLKSNSSIQPENGESNTFKRKKVVILNWISEHIIGELIVGVILFFIGKKYFS